MPTSFFFFFWTQGNPFFGLRVYLSLLKRVAENEASKYNIRLYIVAVSYLIP